MQLPPAGPFEDMIRGHQLWRSTGRRYNVRCFDCNRILCVARVLAGAAGEQIDFEWIRLRPDADGNIKGVPSRPKVKWAKLPDGRTAVRCPCSLGAILSEDDIRELYQQALATGSKDIILGAR